MIIFVLVSVSTLWYPFTAFPFPFYIYTAIKQHFTSLIGMLGTCHKKNPATPEFIGKQLAPYLKSILVHALRKSESVQRPQVIKTVYHLWANELAMKQFTNEFKRYYRYLHTGVGTRENQEHVPPLGRHVLCCLSRDCTSSLHRDCTSSLHST